MELLTYMCTAFLVLWHGMFVAINRMGRHTPHAWRLLWLCTTTMAAALLTAPLFGISPV